MRLGCVHLVTEWGRCVSVPGVRGCACLGGVWGGSCGVCAGVLSRRPLTGVFRECGACACVTVAHVTCATRARPPRESVRSLPCRLCEEGESRAESFSRRERATLDAPDSDGGENRRLLPPGAKSATFWGGQNRRLLPLWQIGDFCPGGEKGARRLF